MRSNKYVRGLFTSIVLTWLAIPVSVHTESLIAHPASEKLIWDEEFTSSGVQSKPDPASWTYDTGNGGSGGLQIYCAWAAGKPPCDESQPNSFVGSDGYLHITVRRPAPGVYTSARLKTQNLKSFQYGRVEARIQLPSGQGMWPAFWMLGDNISRINWPACGEIDIMENLGREPGSNHFTIHGPGYQRSGLGSTTVLPGGLRLSDRFHIYGMIWEPRSIAFYFDSPSQVVARDTPANLPAEATWPFDGGRFFFVLNVAVGGGWGGNPDHTTHFPQTMLVDYVRVWQHF
jgi:beta-glucanase (GH16 family)